MSQRPPLGIVSEGLAAISAYRTHDTPTIKLDANESPWPLPPEARARIAEVVASAPLHRYPDLSATELRRVLAARTGASGDELVLGVGSDEIIGILMAALDRPRPDTERACVVMPSPTFVMVPITARVHGLAPIEVPLRGGWQMDLDGMLRAIDEHRPNLVYVASPNNPTGNATESASLRALANAAPDALVIIDEAYGPFSGESAAEIAREHANVALLGTLSKIGLAGLRLGWARLHPELAREVEKARPPYNLATHTQLAARVLLEEMPEVLDAQVRAIVEERGRLGRELAAIAALRPAPSDANFFLVEVEGDAASLHAALASRGIGVRRFAGHPRLGRHLRITVGTPAENDALLGALRELLG
jgi:histidinol-phosphate aminotransferase